jgi:hypothetical protein
MSEGQFKVRNLRQFVRQGELEEKKISLAVSLGYFCNENDNV